MTQWGGKSSQDLQERTVIHDTQHTCLEGSESSTDLWKRAAQCPTDVTAVAEASERSYL